MHVNTIKAIDKGVGSFLCSLFGVFKRKKIVSQIERAAFIQLWGVGETVLTLPAIYEFHKKNPKTKITVVCTDRNKELYQNIPFVKTHTVPLSPFSISGFMLANKSAFDLTIDLEEYLNISAIMAFFIGKYTIGFSHGSRAQLYSSTVHYNDNQHCAQTFADLLRPLGMKKKVTTLEKIAVKPADRNKVKSILGKKKGKVILLSPGAAESSKMRMWKTTRWIELIKKLKRRYRASSFYLVGAQDVDQLNQHIIKKLNNNSALHNLAGKTSITQLAALCETSHLMVSIDSGPMHIAAAQGTPTIGLFSPNTPVRFGPLGKKCISIYKPITKHPVINVHKGQVPEDQTKDYLRKITVNDVYAAAKKLLK